MLSCDRRAVGCHATCAAYIEWKQATAKKSEAAKKRKAYMDATGYEISKAIRLRVRSDIIKRGKGE